MSNNICEDFYTVRSENENIAQKCTFNINELHISKSSSPPPIRRQKRIWGNLDPKVTTNCDDITGINWDE